MADSIHRTKQRPRGGKYDPGRSVRVSDEVWDKAKRRAQYEGVTMSHVVAMLAEGYGEGWIDLPKVAVKWNPTRQPGEADKAEGDGSAA